jgi:SAM-dependent methyltransferase
MEKPMDSYEDGLARVAAVWADQAAGWRVGRGVHWVEHERVQARINYKVTDDHAIDRYQYFVRKYFGGRTPVDRALTLGCGAGELERGLAAYDFCRQHDAFDISDGAIACAIEASAVAALSHTHYRVADLNQIVLEPEHYDVVFGVSSVHHVAALEHLFEQVSRALTPGGYFFLDEFVGPSQFQWSSAQLDAVNRTLLAMPLPFRRSVTQKGALKPTVVRPTIESMNQFDPSEAIRSAAILPLLPRYFDIVEIKGQGGSLLHLLLEDIVGNFDERNEGSIAYLDSLFELEDRLIADGVLGHDFATIVARKRA